MWATTNGIDGRSLHAWHLNLTRGKFGAERPVSLVEYVPAGSVEVASPSAARYRVWCGPFAVEVDGAFDANVLRRLLSVVAAC